MTNPINFSFVSQKDLDITDDDGKQKVMTVLVLDKEANNDYWKRIGCFPAFFTEIGLERPEQAKKWEISTTFAQCLAMHDIASDVAGVQIDPLALSTWFGIPVDWIESTDVFCRLVMPDDTKIENTFWM